MSAPAQPSPHEHNRRVWDDNVRRGQRHTLPATEKQFQNPLKAIDPCGWLGGDVTGKRLLCLAAGGGKHSVLFAAAGARVTVVDISGAQLEHDRRIAAERGLHIRVVEGSMDHLPMLDDASFDIVMHPVSTCYVPDIASVYREVARVTAPGGVYISQHKQPVNLQADHAANARGYVIAEPYYRTGPLPPVLNDTLHREVGTLEFLHRWEQLLGNLCRAGFVIEDVAEPKHADPTAEPGSFKHRSQFIPPYIKIKARRTEQQRPRIVWTP
jgi:ubiquinone/menaquinone biosynthesis C-methylase UbiE